VCKFNFEKNYGVVAKDFIHVHHLTKISSIKESYKINPEKDLVPVCPNCHSIIHKRKIPYTIEEMKKMIKKNIK
jgi:5-methylcytosine-specific restriction protein A